MQGRITTRLETGEAEKQAGVAALAAVFTVFFAARHATTGWTGARLHPGQSASGPGALGLDTSNVSAEPSADSEVSR